MLGESPRSEAIRRLIKERAVERGKGPTPSTPRTLDFDEAGALAAGGPARKRTAPDSAGETTHAGTRQRLQAQGGAP
eukprot:733489-Pleurochrysis_carterae.AAC.1